MGPQFGGRCEITCNQPSQFQSGRGGLEVKEELPKPVDLCIITWMDYMLLDVLGDERDNIAAFQERSTIQA